MTTPIFLISAMPTLIIGVVFLMMPRVRAGILFGVSVPVEFADSDEGKNIIGRYRTHVLAVIFAALTLSGLTLLYGNMAIAVAAILLETPFLCWAWVDAWRRTKPFGVKVPLMRRASLIAPTRMEGFPLLQVASLLPPLYAAISLRSHWAQIPARFATHWGADNLPNRWVHKSTAGVFGPLFIGLLLILAILLLTWLVTRVRPDQAGQMRPILLVVSWMMSALFTMIALHPLSADPDAGPRFVFWILGAGMVALVGSISYSLTLARSDRSGAWDGTPDSGWRWGLVYYNPADATVLVRNRFGLGWTLNFARPQAKLWVALTLLLSIAIAVLAIYSAHAH